MKRLSHRGKDKSKAFDGTINAKSIKLVHTLIELLNKQVSLEGIYRIPGDMGEVRRTKEALNQGKKMSYEGMNPHTQASLLKSFFKDLDDSVFTAKLYQGWIAATQHKDRKILITRLLNMLPQQNFQIISALMIHLRLISQHHTANLMTPENLAIVFGPILLRPSSVSAATLLADVPYVNKCIGLLINECSFFFQNKLILLHRQTKQTTLFEDMRKAGAELIVEERKKREKEEKRLKEEQRKSERKKKFNTYSSSKRQTTQTVKALIDSDYDTHKQHNSGVGPHPSTSPAPDPSSPGSGRKGQARVKVPPRPVTSYNPTTSPPLSPTSAAGGGLGGADAMERRQGPPALPPLPHNLPPPPPINAATLRRTVSAYNPVPAPGAAGGGVGHAVHGSTTSRGAPITSPRARPARPIGIMMPSAPLSAVRSATALDTQRNGCHLEYDDRGVPIPPPPPPPMELTEEEKKKKEEDENLLHNMRRRYVDRRKQTLDRWFKRKNDWTEEEFNKAMEERAARIENGEYSTQDLQMWFTEMGQAEVGDDEDPLNHSQVVSTHNIAGDKNGLTVSEDGEERSPGSSSSSTPASASAASPSTKVMRHPPTSGVTEPHATLCVS